MDRWIYRIHGVQHLISTSTINVGLDGIHNTFNREMMKIDHVRAVFEMGNAKRAFWMRSGDRESND